MNDPQTVALTLWSRLIAGEMLDEVDLQQLIVLTRLDSSLREEIEADATLHALLRSVMEVQQTEDQFAQSVLARCRAMESDVWQRIEENRVENDVVSASLNRHPANDCPESAPVNEALPSLIVNRSRQGETAYRKRRHPVAWKAIALTGAVFACLGLITWTQVRPPLRQAVSESAGEVAQTPTHEQSGQPETDSSTVGDSVPSRPIANAPGNAIHPTQNVNSLQEPTRRVTSQKAPEVPHESIVTPPGSRSPVQFVTLSKVKDPVWERTSMIGDRLGDEIVGLYAGSVELTFDQGAVVTVDGPVEFRPLSTGQLELRRGRLVASVPQKAMGFTVSTPTSTIVDLGTEFEVAVNDAGESDVQVLKGEVEVSAIIPDGNKFQKWRLMPSKFDRASFYASPRIPGPTPISASLRGARGQFQGFVSLDGRTAEFSSPEAFENVRRRAVTELSRSQEIALKQWKDFVDSMQKSMQGTMNFNGQEMQFGSMQDVMRMQRQMLENLQRAGSNSGESTFTGSISVNGKVMTFKTREEYEAARQAAFGPAATFGIGDVFGEAPSSR
ncbi:MAG: FecR family protein [Planctomycetaceae bacterium]